MYRNLEWWKLHTFFHFQNDSSVIVFCAYCSIFSWFYLYLRDAIFHNCPSYDLTVSCLKSGLLYTVWQIQNFGRAIALKIKFFVEHETIFSAEWRGEAV